MVRYSARRLTVIRNAPPIQYPSIRLLGGRVVGATIAQPSNSRIGLFSDSVATSRIGRSLVRRGSTL